MAYDPSTCPDEFGCDSNLTVDQKLNAAFTSTEGGCVALRVDGTFSAAESAEDNTAITENNPTLSGGKAVDITTYTPAYTAGDAVTAAFNKDTGALLVHQANLSRLLDSITVYRGTPTAYTYSCGVSNLAVAASATDVFEIHGSATKTIRIKRASFSGVATTAATTTLQLVVRNTSNTVGTSSSPAIVPNDSQNPAVTAVVKAYTANPTTGTLVGIARTTKASFPLATAANNFPIVIEFGKDGSQEIVLRGIAQSASFNLGGVTVAGGSINAAFEWTEE